VVGLIAAALKTIFGISIIGHATLNAWFSFLDWYEKKSKKKPK
jgi:hypothetical protein